MLTTSKTTFSSDSARLQSFGAAIDGIRRSVQAKVGQEDLSYIRGVDRVARLAEFAGRTLIAVSPGPMLFTVGVLSLWIHKQLQATEIGHTALHGAFNKIEGAGKFHSAEHRWGVAIDERSWIAGHNGRHHGLTNVAGQDPDIEFGPVRLTQETPHTFAHYLQLPFTLFVLFPNFALGMNLHLSGVSKLWWGEGGTAEEKREARAIALRKALPYYAREYLLFPTVATLVFGWWLGPIVFAKSLAGNWLAEKLRDVYTAATIYCGHVGEDTAAYSEGTMPASKGERYAMQVESANNFEVPRPISQLCGALDLQIEHHLFPTLPTERLREVSGDVREACEAHGVEYRSDTWPRTLWKALKQVARLSRKLPHERAQRAHVTSTPATTIG